MADLSTIENALQHVKARIHQACLAAERSSESVRLLAVSKTMAADKVIEAYQAGQREFGENYVQEGVEKVEQLTHLSDIVWHFIGPIQSNKTKVVAENFSWVQSLDRIKVARRLNEQRPLTKVPLNVLIQLNIDDEESKSGIQLEQLTEFAEQVNSFPQLKFRGLMAIPKATSTERAQQQSFQALNFAFNDMKRRFPSVDTLSLGMSNDLATAIAHGSTMVRIGTSIFGKRQA